MQSSLCLLTKIFRNMTSNCKPVYWANRIICQVQQFLEIHEIDQPTCNNEV